ncbi:hypothetical protein Gotur_034598 [Gossypium turneri]
MSSQNSANLVATHDNKMSKENRHLADFNPNFWGDIFLSSPAEMNIDAKAHLQYEELKQQVRRMLVISTDKPYQNLDIIDAIQRLGVTYHFEKEIEDALHIIYQHHCNNTQIDDDLYTASVRFRLLREHGFNVCCANTFNKFIDEKGKFKESLISDVKGMLELYEAAHFQLHGETILKEALAFTMFHLNLPRLVARSYIPIYEGYATHDKISMKFAKLDFNMVQHLHKEELSKTDVATNFPFIQDRLVESYFWILGIYFEPVYTIARTFMTKVISLTSILDDIYDAYGTYEELEIFMEAIQRWDINCIDQLPDYMKVSYSEILNVYKEMEDLMSKEGKSFCVQFVIKAVYMT